MTREQLVNLLKEEYWSTEEVKVEDLAKLINSKDMTETVVKHIKSYVDEDIDIMRVSSNVLTDSVKGEEVHLTTITFGEPLVEDVFKIADKISVGASVTFKEGNKESLAEARIYLESIATAIHRALDEMDK